MAETPEQGGTEGLEDVPEPGGVEGFISAPMSPRPLLGRGVFHQVRAVSAMT